MTNTEAKLIGAIECYTKLKASLSNTYLASHVVQEMQEAFIQTIISIASNVEHTPVEKVTIKNQEYETNI